MKAPKKFIPEIILLMLSLYWIIDLFMGHELNVLMLIISSLIGIQLLLRNKILAVFLSCIMGFGGIIMIGATISEFSEFSNKGSLDALTLLSVGCLLAGLVIWMAVLMSSKFFKKIEH